MLVLEKRKIKSCKMPDIKKKIFILTAVMSSAFYSVLAQIPEGVPHPDDNEPIRLDSLADIIIYIVLPVGLVILYVLWKRRVRQRKKKEDNDNT
jgi:hypothetical protein